MLLKLDIQQNIMGIWVVIQIQFCLFFQSERQKDNHAKRVWEKPQQIVTLFLYPSLKVL